MKKALFTFTLAVLATFSSQAQKMENSLLWEISGNDLEAPSYVYGTIHMTCDASLSDVVKTALENTSLLVLELDMDDPNMNTTMMSNMAMKENTNIKDLLTDEEYASLNEFVQAQFGAPLSAFETFKPFFLSAMLYTKFLDCPIQSFEGELVKVAHEQEEEVLGLETVEEQLKIFDDIPYEDQIKDLLVSISDNLVSDKEKFQTMLELYNNQDLEGIKNIMDTDETLMMTKHIDLMLVNRNKNWISKIESFSKEQPTFFGVGAAHLIGENGVVQLLKDQGYTLTPIK